MPHHKVVTSVIPFQSNSKLNFNLNSSQIHHELQTLASSLDASPPPSPPSCVTLFECTFRDVTQKPSQKSSPSWLRLSTKLQRAGIALTCFYLRRSQPHPSFFQERTHAKLPTPSNNSRNITPKAPQKSLFSPYLSPVNDPHRSPLPAQQSTTTWFPGLPSS